MATIKNQSYSFELVMIAVWVITVILIIVLGGRVYARVHRSSSEELHTDVRTWQHLEREVDTTQDESHKIAGEASEFLDNDGSNLESASNSLTSVDFIPLGEFKVTAYTSGPESTGKNLGDPAYGITASGTAAREGLTIAADWDKLPAGSTVFIEGVGIRTVEDKGGLIVGACIDLFVEDLEYALEWGVQYKQVWLIKEGE